MALKMSYQKRAEEVPVTSFSPAYDSSSATSDLISFNTRKVIRIIDLIAKHNPQKKPRVSLPRIHSASKPEGAFPIPYQYGRAECISPLHIIDLDQVEIHKDKKCDALKPWRLCPLE